MQAQRLNITLPADLAREFRRTIPSRSRSKFIAQAVSDKLSKRKRISKKEWIKAFKANKDYYRRVSKEIEEDFKYADAEVAQQLP